MMSGPISPADAAPEPAAGRPADAFEVMDSRVATVGEMSVRRALPQRGRRTVGAWCFLDHAGPVAAGAGRAGIGPHPHIGLQTVTWVLDGELVHRDSIGTEQPIRPGELNLMTAGWGIAHAEEHPHAGALHLAQLWVTQPASTRNGPPAFEHHRQLPRVELGRGSEATVLIGQFEQARSDARRDTDHVGVDLLLRSDVVLQARQDYEYGLVPLDGTIEVEGRAAPTGSTIYLGPGREQIRVKTSGYARALLVGGIPFNEPIVMWWNYVARTRDEITEAHREWTARSDRFSLPASTLGPIDTTMPPWSA